MSPSPGKDALDEQVNPGLVPGAPQPGVQRGFHRPAALVPQHHEDWRLQVGARVLDAAGHFGADDVAGDPDHEQLAQPCIEHELGRHAGIAAADDCRKWPLARYQGRASCV